jgi:hypothetical protein
VASARLGGDDDARAGELRPPADVQVLARRARTGAEASQRTPKVGTHERRAAWGDEHLARPVVLALVELAPLHEGVHHAEAVCAHTNGQEVVRRVPGDELRARKAGVTAVGLLEQETHTVCVEGHVVMADEHVACAFNHAQRRVGRSGEAGAGREGGKVGVREKGGDSLGRAGTSFGSGGTRLGVCASSSRSRSSPYVDNEDRKVAIVLGSERAEDVFEPTPRVTGHDHRHYGGCARHSVHLGHRA